MLEAIWCLAGAVVAVAGPAFVYAALRPAHRSLHWSERARRLTPLRGCLTIGVSTLPLGALWVAWQIGGWRLGVTCGVAAFVGVMLSARLIGLRIVRALEVALPFARGDFWASTLGKLPLQLAWLVPFVAGALAPWPSNAATVALTLVGALFYVRYQSTWLLWMGHFRGAHSTLVERVRAVADGHEVRGVYEMQLGLANAMALPWSREVSVTRGAMHVLAPDELDAVLAHELEHLDEPLWLRATRLLPLAGRVALGGLAGYTAAFDDRALGVLVLLLGAFVFLLGWRIARAVWTRAEAGADDAGQSVDPEAYGRALLALYRANLFPVVSSSGSGHAPLLARMREAGLEPDFEAPGRHSQTPPLITLALAAAMLAGLAVM